MNGLRIAVLVLVGLSLVTAFAPAAESSHRCYTIGDYPVCRYIPGDEHLECFIKNDWVQCLLP